MKNNKFKFIVILIFILSLNPVYALRIGGLLSVQSGDTLSDLRSQSKTSIFLRSDLINFQDPAFNLLNNKFMLFADTGINTYKKFEINGGLQIPLFNYGPRRYSLKIAGFLGHTRTLANALALVVGLNYEEEITSGFFLDAQAQLNTPSKYLDNPYQFEISLGVKTFFDTNPSEDEVTRLKFVDVSEILAQNMVVKEGELKEDLTERIKSFSNLTEAQAVQMPKFVEKGVAFKIKKNFPEGTEIKSLTYVISDLSDKKCHLKILRL